MLQEAKTLIEKAWKDRRLLRNDDTIDAIKKIINLLDKGDIRAAEPSCTGEWLVNEWIKKAIILYFAVQEMNLIEVGPFEFHDKIPLKKGFDKIGARIVPPAIARYGSYIDKDVVIMPSYINIGAHIETGTLIDTGSVVGSCAQIGKNVHLSCGAVIGGVLQPPQALPVIIEDGCFIGSCCSIKEGVHIEKEVIVGGNLIITQSTQIFNVSSKDKKTYKGFIPARSIVIPGTYKKKFPAGEFQVQCALIVGQRKQSDDLKVSLKAAIKEFKIAL